MTGRGKRWWGVLILLGYAAALAALLLWPSGNQVRRINLDIYLFGLNTLRLPIWVTPEGYAAVANILVPAPLAAALTMLDARGRWVLWAGLVALSCGGAEIAQWVFLPGRDPEVSDVMLNAVGAFLGAGLVALRPRRRAPG